MSSFYLSTPYNMNSALLFLENKVSKPSKEISLQNTNQDIFGITMLDSQNIENIRDCCAWERIFFVVWADVLAVHNFS